MKITHNYNLLFKATYSLAKGAFTNYVDKRRGVGSPKCQLFVNIFKVENVNGGGQKSQKLVNLVCDRPLNEIETQNR